MGYTVSSDQLGLHGEFLAKPGLHSEKAAQKQKEVREDKKGERKGTNGETWTRKWKTFGGVATAIAHQRN